MQLKSLELYGFKSFADRHKFVFDKGITGIVGPNGCGKSNVVDALRWVLGEQKIKNLRSEKMENIIFNGTSIRRRANYCEVTLSFENTKNILPTEYTTVSITRKYYRDGESQYFINNVSCRLKDIQNLFLDTGIGPDSYAIIELKMVDEILNDKENSRRKLFEEAAGISKYKIRKKQTLKKLEDTQLDLDRVDDVLYEINKNLKSLENQAKKAKKYFTIKEEYKVVSSQFAYLKVKDLKEALEKSRKGEQKFVDEALKLQSAIAKLEARKEELRQNQLKNEKNLQEEQKGLNHHIQGIQQIEKDKSIKNERLKFLQQREYAIKDQIGTDNNRILKLEEEKKNLLEKINETHKSYTTEELKFKKLKEQLEERKTNNSNLKEDFEKNNTQFRKDEKNLNDLKKEIEIKRIQIEGFKNEVKRNESDQNTKRSELDSFSPQLKILSEELKKLSEVVDKLKNDKKENQEAVEKTRNDINSLKDAIYRTNRLLDARKNEHGLVKSLVENLEGFPDSVKYLKKEAAWVKEAPLLSDILNAPEEFKVAFENLLTAYLNYFIVSTRKDASNAVHLLAKSSKGRANFFILDELLSFQTVGHNIIPGSVPATELVEVEEKYKKLSQYLLDGVFVIKDESLIPDEIPEGTTIITQNGSLSSQKFKMAGGSVGLFQGKRLGRAQNLVKLEREIKELSLKLEEEKKELSTAEQNLINLRQKDNSKELEKQSVELQSKKKEESVLETRDKEYREFIRKAGERSELITQQIEKIDKELIEAIPHSATLLEKYVLFEKEISKKRILVEESTTALNRQMNEFNLQNISFIQLKNKLDNLNEERLRKQQETKKHTESLASANIELRETRDQIELLVSTTLQNDEEIVSLYDEKKRRELRTSDSEQKAALIRNSLLQVEEKIKEERTKKEKTDNEKGEYKEKMAELKVEMSGLSERMKVEFQVEIDQLSKVELFDQEISTYNPDEIQKKLLSLREKIQTYGAINPMAVEAYDEMKKRFDFIQEQKKDLIDSEKTLNETIKEIDGIATKKFEESFHSISENFQKVFRTLFHEGDTCDLILDNPSQPLDSKINITAKPKGKRPLTINQLSGGEKTLTAISLLFAIYLLKPAPFCVFDEVDAPLDDANIDKFNNIIKEFSADSQFLIVTHNKRTMANTQIMYGVTNKTPGVSEVAAVDLKSLNLD